ncbi:hypothetical protein TOPH_03567 [Tolypocladium ophioglossoides CBS 100239]|uniref:Uncharacterized protein n=1 Tax=Tolypocladium ophioglossoides (strain CBS 100239) TaxID=1163406 RepID=A0A0L0NDB6_TOLOC|nr:hypothetical protein TOPH_03567 [Tolypocladium ophioglossoides CBS 100239]
MPRPIVLSPATPSELLTYILSYHTYPTTLLISWPRQQFLDALVQDMEQQLPPPASQDDHHPSPKHPLLRATLMQVAVARHIRILFIPTTTHLRAYLATFSAAESRIPPPPNLTPSGGAPLLLVYGFLEPHRHGSEWSAQGLNTSAAGFVESAARNGFRAAIAEPRRTDADDELRKALGENVPVLNGTTRRDDGSWSGQTVPIQKVLARWFEFESPKDVSK